MVHPVIEHVTQTIVQRSKKTRAVYVARMEKKAGEVITTVRAECGSCSGLAHVYATAGKAEKALLVDAKAPNIGIVTGATDMLSAHQPFFRFPDIIKHEALKHGATAQIIAPVTSICDGTVQGREGMELSLFSRDVIALSTINGLSHNISDGIIALATCDKIKPGVIMGLASWGHLPVIFAPAGPMTTGQSNEAKKVVRRQRELEKKGEVPEAIGMKGELLSEIRSYHGPGTCTFYGTANGNEMVAELMGLQLPGSSFVNPHLPLRDAFTRAATKAMATGQVPPLYQIVDERAFVNGMVVMLATGGSTNLTLHFPAIACAFGIHVTWDDMSELSTVVPSIVRIYPNGPADINEFQKAGGTAVLASTLLDGGYIHEDVWTVAGKGLHAYTQAPTLDGEQCIWQSGSTDSADSTIITTCHHPFSPDGGIKVLRGRLGQAICKTSSLDDDHRGIRAPARVFHSQAEMQEAYHKGELTGDFVAVVRGQGPHQNGMPELHKLITPLADLQKKGQTVALLTNGRLSGASGDVLAAIHLSVASCDDEPINKIRNGDVIIINSKTHELDVDVPEDEWNARECVTIDRQDQVGDGRERFAFARKIVRPAHEGASFILE